MLGLKKAVFNMLIPNVMPDKVVCDLNDMRANTLHIRARKTPITGMKIDIEANTKAVIANGFIQFPFVILFLGLRHLLELDSKK